MAIGQDALSFKLTYELSGNHPNGALLLGSDSGTRPAWSSNILGILRMRDEG